MPEKCYFVCQAPHSVYFAALRTKRKRPTRQILTLNNISHSHSVQMRHIPFGRACAQPKVPLVGHRTAHGESKEAATPEQELVCKLEVGARLARLGICCPIWADGDNGQTATINATRSLGILELPAQALPPRAEPAAHQVVSAEWHVAPMCKRDQIRLRDHFQDRLLAKAMGVEWCPYSPALTPPDFFL